MSGTFAALSVISGQVGTTAGALYTSTAVTYLKQVLLYNEGPTTVAITVYLIPTGGNAVPFRNIQLEPDESYKVLEHGESITLGVGDAFAAVADTANAIDYLITGVFET